MDDERLETDVRAFLSGRALEPGPSVRARLAGVTAEGRRPRLRAPAGAVAGWAVVVVVAVAGFALATRLGAPVTPGAVELPPETFVPVSGSGFYRPDTPWGHLIVGAIVLAGWLLSIAFAGRPLVRAALVVGLAAAAVGVAGLATTDPVEWPDQTWATGEGYVDTVTGGDGTNEWSEHWFAVGEDEPFQFGFEVRNAGPLPMTILGIDEPNSPTINYALVAIGLGEARGPSTGRRVSGDAQPFRRVVLQPGDRQVVVVAGTGGVCAEPTLPSPDARTGIGLPSIMLAYSVLGWERVERVAIQDELFVGVRINCRGATPG